jgi:quinoprotein glucose dehydrogenase
VKATVALVIAVSLSAFAQDKRDHKPYVTWSDYAGSADSMQYSALDQINRSTVRELERAWFYPVSGDPERLAFNPLIVDDVMYVAGAKNVVIALDAVTGRELWKSTEEATERGITYWENTGRKDSADRKSPQMNADERR